MTSDPLRHHTHHTHDGQASVMERIAEAVASGLGTVAFVALSTLLIVAWIAVNVTGVTSFDRFPFILLNLMFSAQAFYTGALVIIAQKAQGRVAKLDEIAAAKHRQEEADEHRRLLAAVRDKVDETTPGGLQVINAKLDRLLTERNA